MHGNGFPARLHGTPPRSVFDLGTLGRGFFLEGVSVAAPTNIAHFMGGIYDQDRAQLEDGTRTGLFSLFWRHQRPPLAPTGSGGDVPVPWGGRLPLEVALVCCGVLWWPPSCGLSRPLLDGRKPALASFGAAAVPVGRLAATAVANRPTASPAEAACGLGVMWGHVLWL